jgi:hypothetical protein
MPHPSNSAVADASSTSARSTAGAATGDFVINLCASTSPMALARPSTPELARFTFFVSRRREEGRERFRLHMGYFVTRGEAEQMLLLVRDVYPAAWVGEAPGKKLRAGGTAPAAAPRATPPAAAVVPAAPPAAAPMVAPMAAPSVAAAVATAAPGSATRAPSVEAAAATLQAPRPNLAAPKTPPAASATVPSVAAHPAPAPTAPAARVATPAKPARQAPPAATVAAVPPAFDASGSNVREVLADLDRPETQHAAAAPAPAARTANPPTPSVELTDSQILRVLEQRSPTARAPAPTGAARDISLLSPQDTQTWRDIKAQLKRDATVHFAVQLEWSASEIDLARIPGLAIFNAYTLYKIEGNREGRKWYGLRLGFFSDAVSAKQVAYYVRSEFAQVAVVPVSTVEREQAREVGAIELPRAAPTAGGASGRTADEAITLIDDRPAPAPAAPAAIPTVPPAEAPAVQGRGAPGKTAKRRPDRPRGAPQTLEETLEILGASQLSIDTGKGERLQFDQAPRRQGAQASTFSKLLDRLTERLRK